MRTTPLILYVKYAPLKVSCYRISAFVLFLQVISVFVLSFLAVPSSFAVASQSNQSMALPPLIEEGEPVKKGQKWYNEHVRGICSSSFNTQGSLLAITSIGKPIELWDIAERKLIATFFGSVDSESASVNLSPDGNLIAFSMARRVELRDIKTQELLFSIPVIDGGLSILSKDGRYLASAIDGKRIDLWDIQRQQRVHSFTGNKQTVTALTFSNDGRYLLSANKKGLIKVWDIVEKQFMYQLDQHKAPVTSLVFTADSKRFVTVDSSGETRVWGIERAELLHTLTKSLGKKGDFTTAVAISPNGQRILRVLNGVGNNIQAEMFDVLKGKLLFSLPPLNTKVNSLVFLPDNRSVAFSFSNKIVKVFDSGSQRFIDSFGGQLLKARRAAMSPDGRFIAVGTLDGVLQFWEAKQKFLSYSLKGHKNSIEQLVFSPDGQLIAAGDDDGRVTLWNLNSKQLIWSVKAHKKGRTVFAISPDNQFLMTSSIKSSVITLWDIKSRQSLYKFRGHHAGITDLRYTADGKKIVSSSNDGSVKLWDVEQRKMIHSFGRGLRNKKFTSLDISHDGKYVAAGVNASSDIHGIEIWGLESFERRYSLNDHFKQITAVKFSPDSRQLVSASKDGSIKIWDLTAGELSTSLHKKEIIGKVPASVYSVAFANNGQEIISVDDDGEVNSWNIRHKRLDYTMIGGPRGTWLSENHVKQRFWRGDDGSLIATVDKKMPPQPVAPSELAAKDTLVITTRKELEVPADGGKVSITVNNKGRNPSFWIQVRQRDNKNTPITLLPNKLTRLAAGQTKVMDIQFITHDLDFIKKTNKVDLQLELITKAGSTFPIDIAIKLVSSKSRNKSSETK